ncbi:hypothetical protein BSKO_09314 [Bryopsis sp. KO-2023]|nr:hypothetical protein BSKO_09314 [Bryopsis sp. KO-2023]
MRGGSLLNGFRNLPVFASRGLEDASVLSVAAHFDRLLQTEGAPWRFASSDTHAAPDPSSERRKTTNFNAKRDDRPPRSSPASSHPPGPAIAKMFVVGGSTSETSSKKRKSPTASGSSDGLEEESSQQSRQVDSSRGGKKDVSSHVSRKPSVSPRSTQPASSKLHAHSDLTLVKKLSAKSGAPPSDDLMTSLKAKTSLLKEWGVHWRSEEMNRIFNWLGENWVKNTRVTELETMFLQLERAYEIPMKTVGQMVSRNPDILSMNVEKSLRKMEFFFMTGLGYKRGEMSHLVSSNPEMFSYDQKHMPLVVHFMRNELGISKQFLRAVIDKHPTVLKTDFQGDTFQRNFSFVAASALGRNARIEKLKVLPPLSHDNKCQVCRILVLEPQLMTMQDLPAVRKLFRDIGLQDWEVAKICVKYPQIFPEATTLDLDRKLAFLMEFCDRTLEEIFRYGSYLYKPIDEVYARFGFVQCLGLDQKQWGLKEIIGAGPVAFCKKVTLTSAAEFSTFAKSWKPPKEWTECNTLRSRLKPNVEERISETPLVREGKNMVEENSGGGGEEELRDLVRKLGSTDPATRTSGLHAFSEFLKREELDEAAMLKLWRGLFYGLWYTPGYQAQMEWVTEMCKGILDQTQKVALLFWKAFLLTICKEWRGLDKYRLDKFYLLARHVLRAAFVKMGSDDWGSCSAFTKALHECVFPTEKSIAAALGYHFAEIFLTELQEASKNHELPTLSRKHHKRLFSGFVQILISDAQTDVLKRKVREEIFDVLVEETVGGGAIQPPFGPTLAKDLKKMLAEVEEHSLKSPDAAMAMEEAIVDNVETEKKVKSKKDKKKVALGPKKKISKKGSSKKKKKAPVAV